MRKFVLLFSLLFTMNQPVLASSQEEDSTRLTYQQAYLKNVASVRLAGAFFTGLGILQFYSGYESGYEVAIFGIVAMATAPCYQAIITPLTHGR